MFGKFVTGKLYRVLGKGKMVITSVGLAAGLLAAMACQTPVQTVEVEVTREIPVTRLYEVTREVPVTREVEVTRQVEISRNVEVTREVPVTREIEVTRQVDVSRNVEVTREVPITRVVEVTRVATATHRHLLRHHGQGPLLFLRHARQLPLFLRKVTGQSCLF